MGTGVGAFLYYLVAKILQIEYDLLRFCFLEGVQ